MTEHDSPTLRAGVVGAGVFGGFHAGKYAAHPGVDFVGVFDPDPARSAELAGRHGGRAIASLADLIAETDALTIASPARAHGPAARAALDAGRHVLVEKPIATSLADADVMVATAEAKGLVLQVGHQERFVSEAMGLFSIPEAPLLIEARRFGAFSERGSDVSVTLDLMTHDIDLARLLARRAPVTALEAETVCERTPFADRAHARIVFEGGVEARLAASRLHHDRERIMRLTYPSGVVEVDFVAKTFTNTTPHPLDPNFADAPNAKDSLGANVAAFVNAISTGDGAWISGADGREALALALRIDAEG